MSLTPSPCSQRLRRTLGHPSSCWLCGCKIRQLLWKTEKFEYRNCFRVRKSRDTVPLKGERFTLSYSSKSKDRGGILFTRSKEVMYVIQVKFNCTGFSQILHISSQFTKQHWSHHASAASMWWVRIRRLSQGVRGAAGSLYNTVNSELMGEFSPRAKKSRLKGNSRFLFRMY